MKKKIRAIIKCMLLMAGMILLSFLLLVVVYSLPVDKMYLHVKESSQLIENWNSDHNQWAPGIESTTTSYSTDAIMFNNALYCGGRQDVIKNAMLNPRYEDGQGSPVKSLIKALQYDNVKSIRTERTVYSQPTSCRDEENVNGELETMYYPNYWHGYLVFLKPLLLFFNVSEIKIFCMMIQFFLLGSTLLILYSRLGLGTSSAFLFTVIILNPITMVLTFQEADVYIITLLAVITLFFLDKKKKKKTNYIFFFMIVGAATCFIDFLTYPLVSLGIPLSIYIILNDQGFKKNVWHIFWFSLVWGVGYAGLWFGKFIMCSITTNYNALNRGVQQILFRIGSDHSGISGFETTPKEALIKNIKALFDWPTVGLWLLVIFIVVVLILRGYHYSFVDSIMSSMVLIAMFPIIWFLVASNHSAIHPYMTYRELAITSFCVFYILLGRWKIKQHKEMNSSNVE